MKNANGVIAVSKEDLKLFKKIYPKTVLIENGVSLPNPKPKKEKNRFLFVGRFSKNKRIDLLIKTFSKIPNSKLIIAGNDFDNLLPSLKELTKELEMEKRVEFKLNLPREKIFDEYNKAEYFVSASEYEGFGITAIEAMHFGCVCILNDIPTFRDFCKGGRGYLIDFNSPNKTTIKILKILETNKKNVKKNYKKYTESFKWTSKIIRFIKIYSNL